MISLNLSMRTNLTSQRRNLIYSIEMDNLSQGHKVYVRKLIFKNTRPLPLMIAMIRKS